MRGLHFFDQGRCRSAFDGEPVGALGSCFSFLATITIIPFFPDGWAASAGGFPAMTEHVAFLMKDLVLLAVSFYLLREDVKRVGLPATESLRPDKTFLQDHPSLVEVRRGEFRG
jgi:Protein of unknown function, DUF417